MTLTVARLLELEGRVIAGEFRNGPCCIDGRGNEYAPQKGWYVTVESGDTFEGDVTIEYGRFVERLDFGVYVTESGEDFYANGQILVRQF